MSKTKKRLSRKKGQSRKSVKKTILLPEKILYWLKKLSKKFKQINLKTILTPLEIGLVTILLGLDIIGRITLHFLKLTGAFTLYYINSLKKTAFRIILLIQFIGEITLLIGFALAHLTRRSLEAIKILPKTRKRSALHLLIRKTPKELEKKSATPFFIALVNLIKEIRFGPPPAYAVVTSLIIFLLWGFYYFAFFKDLPSPYNLEKFPLPQSSQVLDRNGNLLFLAYNGTINRVPVSLDKVPQSMIKATIATEDQEFYQHFGISPKGIMRALVNNITHRPTQGGSTITQQLVKIALIKDNRRVITRKIKEAYLAILVEKAYSKDKILEMYLNNAPYGGTAYGIEAASRKYFGKDSTQLTLPEAALLASLPSAPSIYSPYQSAAETYKKNQKKVLEQMQEKGYVTSVQKESAYREQLSFYSIENQIMAPHFVFWVLGDLEKSLGKEKVQEGGLKIYTTLDLPTQLKAEQIVKENVEKVEKMYWISNAAALVTEPKTGKILAMVGSRDYFDDQHDGKVNVTVSQRQPGSSIKVVNYAYALASGKFTPSSIVDDSPVSYRNAWETYSPVNYDGKYRGPVTIKQALAMSLNIPAVKVLNTYGADKMRELGIKMGIESWKDLKNYGLSLTLGAGEVKMTELATVYGTFPNLGKRVDLHAVNKIIDKDSKTLADADNPNTANVLGIAIAKAAEPEKVLPEYTAYQLTSILSDNAARMPAFGPYAKLEIPGHKVAVKTGTTNNIRDNWTVGYTPDYLVATWVGNNDNSPMNPNLTSGITGAAPIWNEIMSGILEGKPQEQYAMPEGMIKVKVCAVNGLLTCDRCPKEVEEYFVPGTEPKTKCNFPSVDECKGRKAQMEAEKKSPAEIAKALVNCPAGSN